MTTIDARCGTCGREKADALHLPKDPPDAVAVVTQCPDCGRGPSEVDVVYIGAGGEVIELTASNRGHRL